MSYMKESPPNRRGAGAQRNQLYTIKSGTKTKILRNFSYRQEHTVAAPRGEP
jgi:hypothetical protein